jgi:serine/threonine-protein kinase
VKILDFGISAPAGEEDEDDTGATFGTPAYVAPERLDGMPAVPATDVYGLGVLLFEMVTGEPPYPVDTWEELAEARAAGPGTLPASLPPDFRTLIARCLDDDPAARPPANEVRFDLTALWLATRSGRSSPPSSAARQKRIWDGPAAADEPVPDDSIEHDPATAPDDSHHPGRVTAAFRPGARRVTGLRTFSEYGRAAASTLPMVPPPARRIALTLALVALVVAVVAVFALVNWPRRSTVDARPSPSATAAVPPEPLVTPPPAASPGPAVPATPRLTFSDAVSRMRSAVEDGAAGGEIRSDVATDLLNLIRPLSAADGKDVDTQVDRLRRKITERLGEGSLEPAQAGLLRSRLADLDRAAGT